MNYRLITGNDKIYIELISSDVPLMNEQDALDLISACWENETRLLMIHGEAFAGDFFTLGTGIAGAMLQKLVNYRIKTAAVIPDELTNKGRFREMALEANKGSHFRIFSTKEEAEKWLTA